MRPPRFCPAHPARALTDVLGALYCLDCVTAEAALAEARLAEHRADLHARYAAGIATARAAAEEHGLRGTVATLDAVAKDPIDARDLLERCDRILGPLALCLGYGTPAYEALDRGRAGLRAALYASLELTGMARAAEERAAWEAAEARARALATARRASL